ncbi:MAG: hypothetical protein OXI33_04230 [Chloroflexota bacterium]|nr:hypothetical protein [Chloroflexota bacterium]
MARDDPNKSLGGGQGTIGGEVGRNDCPDASAGDPDQERMREDRRTLELATDRYRTIVQALIQALEPSKERSE